MTLFKVVLRRGVVVGLGLAELLSALCNQYKADMSSVTIHYHLSLCLYIYFFFGVSCIKSGLKESLIIINYQLSSISLRCLLWLGLQGYMFITLLIKQLNILLNTSVPSADKFLLAVNHKHLNVFNNHYANNNNIYIESSVYLIS